MKVAFPTNNQKTIASHIALAKGFLIVDTDTNERFYIQNPIKHIQSTHPRGAGSGRVIPPLLKENGVDALIALEFGEGMLRNLEFEGIEALIAQDKDIENTLKNLTSLEKVTTPIAYRGLGLRRGFARARGFGRGFRGRRGF